MAEGRGGNFLKPFLASLPRRTNECAVGEGEKPLKKVNEPKSNGPSDPTSALFNGGGAVALNRGSHFMGLCGIPKLWTEFTN